MIAVVDYGMGNLHSVRNALDMLGADVRVTQNPEDLKSADRIVLPGVGAFGECVRNLKSSGMIEVLQDEVIRKAKPFLGICLGLQVLAREGLELGHHSGLGWFPATVKKFDVSPEFKVPHVGWNEICPTRKTPLFSGLSEMPAFYFVHSYHFVPDQPDLTAATCNYGIPFTAAILKGNIFATQFHPEKSQQVGLQLLENFLKWDPS